MAVICIWTAAAERMILSGSIDLENTSQVDPEEVHHAGFDPVPCATGSGERRHHLVTAKYNTITITFNYYSVSTYAWLSILLGKSI